MSNIREGARYYLIFPELPPAMIPHSCADPNDNTLRQQPFGFIGHWPRPLRPTAAGIAQGPAKIRPPTHLADSVIT